MIKLRETVCCDPACLSSACFTPKSTVRRIGLGCVQKLQYRVLRLLVRCSEAERDQSIKSSHT